MQLISTYSHNYTISQADQLINTNFHTILHIKQTPKVPPATRKANKKFRLLITPNETLLIHSYDRNDITHTPRHLSKHHPHLTTQTLHRHSPSPNYPQQVSTVDKHNFSDDESYQEVTQIRTSLSILESKHTHPAPTLSLITRYIITIKNYQHTNTSTWTNTTLS